MKNKLTSKKSPQWSRAVLGVGLGLLASNLYAGPDRVTIKSLSYAGSGCPANSVAQNIASDGQALTLLFSDFIAEGGRGVPASESRKNCQLNIEMDFPHGWSLSVASIDYRGYASLDRGVRGTHQSKYYFRGEQSDATFAKTFRGSYDDDYHIKDDLALDAVVWSPCGDTASLNINSQIRVNVPAAARGRSGLMTVDSVDAKVSHKLGLKWKRCGGGAGGGDRPGGGGSGGGSGGDRPGDVTLPGDISINSLIYAGSGCPVGSVAESVSRDNNAFTLIFDDFIAEVGPGVSRRESRKNCQLLIDIDQPAGWTYALATFDYRGFVSLDRGLKATQKATYYFQAQSNQQSFETQFQGVVDKDFVARDVVPTAALQFAPCDSKRPLNINSQVKIDSSRNRNGSGIITQDSVDGKLSQTYGLIWRKCR